MTEFPNGLTVKQLKEIIKNWSENRPCGEETEVWIEKDGLSNQVFSISPLNKRQDAGLVSADFCLSFR